MTFSRNTIFKFIAGGILIFLLGCSAQKITSVHQTRFTIPVLPDTQEAITRRYAMFFSQMNWLAQSKDSLHTPIVLHVGDMVNFDTIPQFELASEGYKILDLVNLPYAIALGNHDTRAVKWNAGSAADPPNSNKRVRMTEKFNSFFPTNRFKLQQGRYEDGKSDNSFQEFKAGGLNWLVITLEFCAREKVAQWMDTVISQYPKHNVIILTHYYVTPKGEIAQSNAGYGDMSPKNIYEKYIKKHPNVLLVLSGHQCYTAYRTDLGTNGNTVYSILSDYQCKDDGGGYIRLLDIDTEKKTITAKMYSPYYNKTLHDESSFEFTNVNFIR